MIEWLMILCMAAGGICFAAGGTGPKWVRRFLLPVILAGVALFAGALWWRCLGMCAGQMVAFSLPYGERTPYWQKFLTGCAFVAPTLFLGLSWWQAITPVAFIVMFALSNWIPTALVFFWKAVEYLTGALVGITVASLLK